VLIGRLNEQKYRSVWVVMVAVLVKLLHGEGDERVCLVKKRWLGDCL
jgi:hypothetical protein